MKKISIVLLLVVIGYCISQAHAVPPGSQVEFTKSSMGKVTFLGEVHKKYNCDVCHATLFKMQKGSSNIAFSDHQGAQKRCFFCHNSGGAFSALENCNRCHIKEATPSSKPTK